MKIYGKKRALAALGSFRRSGRIPHALLFYGAGGIGKRTLADYTAMLYLCESGSSEPCMTCTNCRRIEEHIHPDVVYPLSLMEKGKYQAELLREFITSCYIKPNDGDIRVCIFEKLDEMSPICQNSLLKFIEEPLAFNRYIFTADNKAPILQTVLSRVTAVEIDGADEQEFTAALSARGISPARAAELYGSVGGNIGAAVELEEHGEEMQYLTAAMKAADAVAGKKELDCLHAFSSLKTREEIFQTLGIITDILAQAAALRSGSTVSGAYRAQISAIAASYSLKAITRLYDEASRLYGLSFTNPNVKLFAAECCGALFSAAEAAG